MKKIFFAAFILLAYVPASNGQKLNYSQLYRSDTTVDISKEQFVQSYLSDAIECNLNHQSDMNFMLVYKDSLYTQYCYKNGNKLLRCVRIRSSELDEFQLERWNGIILGASFVEKKISSSTLREIDENKRRAKKVIDKKNWITLYDDSNGTFTLSLKWDIEYDSGLTPIHVEAEAVYDPKTGTIK